MIKLVAVDVDLTVVDSLKPWLQWFESKTGITINPQSTGHYDLVPMMKTLAAEKGITIDPFSWWRQPDLYDYMVPVKGCLGAIKQMQENGLGIVFVSHCVPSHEDSKKRLLKTFFGEDMHFVSTDKKGMVAYDYIIDDQLRVLKSASDLSKSLGRNAQHIHFNLINSWVVCEEKATYIDLVSDSWKEIAQYIITDSAVTEMVA